MKIDITEASKIEDLLYKLRQERATLEYITSGSETEYVAVNPNRFGEVKITRDELLSVINTRIEANVKHLAQRYQLDFAKANVNTVAPVVLAPAAAEEGAQA